MIKLKEDSMIVQVFKHFCKEEPKDLLDILYTLIFPVIALINFGYFARLFFSLKTLYVIDKTTGAIAMTHDPNLGNQFIAFIFIAAGWIIIPLAQGLYNHVWSKESSFYMLFASFGLYSVLADKSLYFALILIILLFKNTGLVPYIAKIQTWPSYQKIYAFLFPKIIHSSQSSDL